MTSKACAQKFTAPSAWRHASNLLAARMRRRLAALLLSAVLLPAFAQAAAQPQRLIPAQFHPLMDNQGNGFETGNDNGLITRYNNGGIDNVGQIDFRGMSCNYTQPQMTPDGQEFVYCANINNSVNLTRRLRFNAQTGTASYIDSYTNASASAATINAAVNFRFCFHSTTMMTDAMRPIPMQPGRGVATVQLAGKETGIFVSPPPGYGNMPSVLVVLGSPKGKFNPSINVQNGQAISYQFTLAVPPGKTMAIAYAISQRMFTTGNPQEVAQAFKAMAPAAWLKTYSAEARRYVVNFGGNLAVAAIADKLESLGVEPASIDILAAGGDTLLRGNASCAGLALATNRGQVELEMDKVAAIAGPRFTKGQARVFLRDGQVLTGDLAAKELRFTLLSGASLELNPANLDRMVLRYRADAPASGPGLLIETLDGNRILAAPDDKLAINFATPWGDLEEKMGDIAGISPLENDIPGILVTLRDGSRFFAYPESGMLEVDTALFGKLKFQPSAIRSLSAVKNGLGENQAQEEEPAAPHIKLTGETLLVGQFDLPALHFLVQGQSIQVEPNQIRSLKAGDGPAGENSTISAELWDGSTISGPLQEKTLPFRSGNRVLSILPRQLASASMPAPVVSESVRDQIAEALRNLGSPEWEVRESASRKLVEFGQLASGPLQEALKQATDPEIKRRLKLILDGLK